MDPAGVEALRARSSQRSRTQDPLNCKFVTTGDGLIIALGPVAAECVALRRRAHGVVFSASSVETWTGEPGWVPTPDELQGAERAARAVFDACRFSGQCEVVWDFVRGYRRQFRPIVRDGTRMLFVEMRCLGTGDPTDLMEEIMDCRASEFRGSCTISYGFNVDSMQIESMLMGMVSPPLVN